MCRSTIFEPWPSTYGCVDGRPRDGPDAVEYNVSEKLCSPFLLSQPLELSWF